MARRRKTSNWERKFKQPLTGNIESKIESKTTLLTWLITDFFRKYVTIKQKGKYDSLT